MVAYVVGGPEGGEAAEGWRRSERFIAAKHDDIYAKPFNDASFALEKRGASWNHDPSADVSAAVAPERRFGAPRRRKDQPQQVRMPKVAELSQIAWPRGVAAAGAPHTAAVRFRELFVVVSRGAMRNDQTGRAR